jgi:glutaredoxin
MRITIYTRKECHLCDDAKAILQRFSAQYPLEIEEIDIDNDVEALQKYSDEVPVVFLEDQKLFKYKIDEIRLRRALDSRLNN